MINLRLLYRFGNTKSILLLIAIIPFFACLMTLLSGVSPVGSLNYFLWVCCRYFLLILVSWAVGTILLHNLRSNDSIKLYNPRAFFWYLSVNVFTPFSVGLFLFITLLILGNTVQGFFSFIVPGVSGSFLVTMLYDVLTLSKKKKEKEDKVKQFEIQKMKADLDLLKMQLDPHFIYNSLNKLSFLTTTNPEKTKKYIHLFASIYRYVLENIHQDWVLLKDELQFVEEYIMLHKIGSNEEITLDISVKDFVVHEYYIPPMSLQLLVENAIKHNSFSLVTPLTIHISIFNGCLLVKNNLITPLYTVPSSRLGLHNLKQRYKILCNKEVNIYSDHTFFTVYLPIMKLSA